MKLFIDVDGTITNPARTTEQNPIPLKEDVEGFIVWAVQQFDCFWLTAWAPEGNDRLIKEKLLPLLPKQAEKIRIGYWKDLKTEAFPFTNGHFLWIDDCAIEEERAFLKSRGWSNRLIWSNSEDRSMMPIINNIMYFLDFHLNGEEVPVEE